MSPNSKSRAPWLMADQALKLEHGTVHGAHVWSSESRAPRPPDDLCKRCGITFGRFRMTENEEGADAWDCLELKEDKV